MLEWLRVYLYFQIYKFTCLRKVPRKEVPVFGTGTWEVQGRRGGICLRNGSVSFDLLDLHSAFYKVYLV